jgi:hypothetical protein
VLDPLEECHELLQLARITRLGDEKTECAGAARRFGIEGQKLGLGIDAHENERAALAHARYRPGEPHPS